MKSAICEIIKYCNSYILTTVNVVVKKQNVFITCSGIVPPVMHRICSPMYCLKIWALISCFIKLWKMFYFRSKKIGGRRVLISFECHASVKGDSKILPIKFRWTLVRVNVLLLTIIFGKCVFPQYNLDPPPLPPFDVQASSKIENAR